jgi:hypothetical protein
MAGWDDVREIASSFPEVEESTQGRASWRVRGKLFAWLIQAPKRLAAAFLGESPAS